MRLFPSALVLATAIALLPSFGAIAQGRGADEAVRAYVQHQAAEEASDRNNRIAARYEALANAPASPVLGNRNGNVTIIVFSDYACPYCRAAEPRLMALARSDK